MIFYFASCWSNAQLRTFALMSLGHMFVFIVIDYTDESLPAYFVNSCWIKRKKEVPSAFLLR